MYSAVSAILMSLLASNPTLGFSAILVPSFMQINSLQHAPLFSAEANAGHLSLQVIL